MPRSELEKAKCLIEEIERMERYYKHLLRNEKLAQEERNTLLGNLNSLSRIKERTAELFGIKIKKGTGWCDYSQTKITQVE